HHLHELGRHDHVALRRQLGELRKRRDAWLRRPGRAARRTGRRPHRARRGGAVSRVRTRLCLAGLFALAGGCLIYTPPPPPPRIVPPFDAISDPLGPGSGRVVLDVVGRRCRVRFADRHRTAYGVRIVDTTRAEGAKEVLCVTPCQIELPLGGHRLLFCERASFEVPVTAEATVFRAALGHRGLRSSTQWSLEPAPALAPPRYWPPAATTFRPRCPSEYPDLSAC